MVTSTFTAEGSGTSPELWRRHPDWAGVPPLELRNGAEECTRLVVVAAHPNDESLGAGGLIASAHEAGLAVYVLLLTAGEASHPESPTRTRHDLATQRMAEAKAALAILAPGAPLVFLGAADGAVARSQSDITTSLVELIGDGRRTLLVAPWREDGHTDHEAAGRAAVAAARRTGARLVQYPIWMWHHGDPADAPWSSLARLDLTSQTLDRKARAIQAHTTQVHPLSEEPGDEVLFSPSVLAHFTGGREHFVVEPNDDDTLDHLHRTEADPWGADVRWYEHRKRELTLATLPRPRFRRALEVGCSRGALAEALAARCDELVAVDRSPTASLAARTRLADVRGVSVQEMDVPGHWPPGRFDLIVVSETGYFLSPADVDGLIDRIADSLDDDGVVLLCHWRHPVSGWVLDGPAVHDLFLSSRLPDEAARYTDRDVEILVLCGPHVWPEPSR